MESENGNCNEERTQPQLERSGDSLAQEYPSIELAYPIALTAYEWAMKRYDGIDERIEKTLTWISTITLAFVGIIAKDSTESLLDPFVLFAMGIFILITGLGLRARFLGKLILLDPEKLYQVFLHMSKSEFKKDIIYRSGQHFSRNLALVNCKAHYLILLLLLFAFEVILFSIGLVSALLLVP